MFSSKQPFQVDGFLVVTIPSSKSQLCGFLGQSNPSTNATRIDLFPYTILHNKVPACFCEHSEMMGHRWMVGRIEEAVLDQDVQTTFDSKWPMLVFHSLVKQVVDASQGGQTEYRNRKESIAGRRDVGGVRVGWEWQAGLHGFGENRLVIVLDGRLCCSRARIVELGVELVVQENWGVWWRRWCRRRRSRWRWCWWMMRRWYRGW